MRILFLAALLTSAAAQTNPIAPTQAAAPNPWLAQAHESTYSISNFHFGSGETLPALHLRYLTLGSPRKDARGHTTNAVLLLHGTGGDASSLLNPVFSNVLFGPGQPLDITRFFLILPDDIGHGKSSKPSDGLHAHFPAYDYDDMVASQHTMLLDGLHVDHLRLILGTSMGCMQAFVWGETFPGFADALAPFACLPVPLAGRNREWRYMAISAIKNDPAWQGGEYKEQPVQGLTTANDLLLLAGGAPLQLQKNYPTRAAVEQYVDRSIARSNGSADANNMIFYINASRNYDPSLHLASIQVPVLWINSADDFINPPELGIAQRMASQMPKARFILLPITDQTRGHGTHTVASIWKDYLIELLAQSEEQGLRK
jgi:homoserine O-acetyltransferase